MNFYTHSGIRYTIDDTVPNKTILNTLRDILDNGVETYNSQLETELHESVSELETKIEDNRGAIELANQRIDQTNGEVEDNTTNIASLDMRVTSLESTSESTTTDLTAVKTKLNNLDNNNPTTVTTKSTLQTYLTNTALAPDIVTSQNRSDLQTYVLNAAKNPNNTGYTLTPLQTYLLNANNSPASIEEQNRTNFQNWADNSVTTINTELESQDARITALENEPAPTYYPTGELYPLLPTAVQNQLHGSHQYYYDLNGNTTTSDNAEYGVFLYNGAVYIKILKYTQAAVTIPNISAHITPTTTYTGEVTFYKLTLGADTTLTVPPNRSSSFIMCPTFILPVYNISSNSIVMLGNNFMSIDPNGHSLLFIPVFNFVSPQGSQPRILSQSNGAYYAYTPQAKFTP